MTNPTLTHFPSRSEGLTRQIMNTMALERQEARLLELDKLRARMLRDMRGIAQAPEPFACRLRDLLVSIAKFRQESAPLRTAAGELQERDEQDTALQIHFLRRMLQEAHRDWFLEVQDYSDTTRVLLLAVNSGLPEKDAKLLAETLVQGLMPGRRAAWNESPRVDGTAL